MSAMAAPAIEAARQVRTDRDAILSSLRVGEKICRRLMSAKSVRTYYCRETLLMARWGGAVGRGRLPDGIYDDVAEPVSGLTML
jgi:hypothetical protein